MSRPWPAAQAAVHMRLMHAGVVDEGADVQGPFDVVLMDMTLSRLLHALLQVRSNLQGHSC